MINRCPACGKRRGTTHRNRVAAARVYIAATEKAGLEVPDWIRKLAAM